jgi:hypothetical protein
MEERERPHIQTCTRDPEEKKNTKIGDLTSNAKKEHRIPHYGEKEKSERERERERVRVRREPNPANEPAPLASYQYKNKIKT